MVYGIYGNMLYTKCLICYVPNGTYGNMVQKNANYRTEEKVAH